jgi:L-aminopeptidase/D-esterase-like protein
MLPNERITPFFTATVQAVDEAVMNALVAARTLTGFEGNTAIALPHEKLRAALKKYNRLEAP